MNAKPTVHPSAVYANALRDAVMTADQKAICWDLFARTNWRNPDAGAWPSVKTLAARHKMSERQVRRVNAQLRDLGAVVVVKPTRGGRSSDGKGLTNIVRLDLAALRRLNPDRVAALDDLNADGMSAQLGQHERPNPDPLSAKPTHRNLSIEHRPEALGMKGIPAIRHALRLCGVKPETRDRIAPTAMRNGWTPDAILTEFESLRESEAVADPAAVLVSIVKGPAHRPR